MTDREIIEDFKDLVEESRQEDVYEYYYKLLNVLNLIQKQDTEINKLKDVIDRMAGKILLMRGVEEYRDKPASREDIKEYFMNKTDIGKEGIK